MLARAAAEVFRRKLAGRGLAATTSLRPSERYWKKPRVEHLSMAARWAGRFEVFCCTRVHTPGLRPIGGCKRDVASAFDAMYGCWDFTAEPSPLRPRQTPCPRAQCSAEASQTAEQARRCASTGGQCTAPATSHSCARALFMPQTTWWRHSGVRPSAHSRVYAAAAQSVADAPKRNRCICKSEDVHRAMPTTEYNEPEAQAPGHCA